MHVRKDGNMVKNRDEIIAMKCRLESVFRKGVELYINDELTSPANIMDCMVNENEIYMPDYILDDVGELVQIRFDRISVM